MIHSVSSSDRNPAHEVTTLTPEERGSSLREIGDSLTTDADDDSIVDDGLAQLRLQQIDRVPSDTTDSALSTSDTLSSYSGCSVGGVGEPHVAVFGGVQEVSQDEAHNEVDSNNDSDSAVLVCSVDGSLCGSVASSQDQGDECIASVDVMLSAAVDNAHVHKTENNSLSWYGIKKIYCLFSAYVQKCWTSFGLNSEWSGRSGFRKFSKTVLLSNLNRNLNFEV